MEQTIQSWMDSTTIVLDTQIWYPINKNNNLLIIQIFITLMKWKISHIKLIIFLIKLIKIMKISKAKIQE